MGPAIRKDIEARTNSLWIGDLPTTWDESTLSEALEGVKTKLKSVKIIRNRFSKAPDGYGFIEFEDTESAATFLEDHNGKPLPLPESSASPGDLVFRLNWAVHGLKTITMQGHGADYAVFVGDLAPDVTDYILQENFRAYYSSVRSAKVITDPTSGRSKGFGFVRFADEAERDRALTEMTGRQISNRVIRVSRATTKKAGDRDGPGHMYTPPPQSQSHPSEADPQNTTLFIGGISAAVSEDDLRLTFARYGPIVYTKVPPGKGCGFVQFVNRHEAETAMRELQGRMLSGSTMRISWGRASRNQGSYPTTGPTGPAQYGYTPEYAASAYGYGYDAYGYGATGADPYAAWAYSAMMDPYQQGYQVQPVPVPVAAPVPVQPTPTSSAANPTSASPASVKPAPATTGFIHAAKPVDPASIKDLNQAYADSHMPMYQYHGHFYRRAYV